MPSSVLSATLTGTLPATVLSTPSISQIANVTADNVISAAEASTPQTLTVNLSGAAAGDVVRLFMDGVQVGNLDLSGWSNSGTTTAADSHTYALWNNGAAHLLIDQNAQVHQVL